MYFQSQSVPSISWKRLLSRRAELVLKEQTDHTSNTMGSDVFGVKTSAGSNMNTTWEVADLRKPLISASRLLERGRKLALDEKPRIQCKNGDTIPLERTGCLFALRLWIPKSFHRQGWT